MADSVDRVFVHALNTVRRIPRTGSAKPPDIDRLKLYGLYKQSTEGDVQPWTPQLDSDDSGGAGSVSESEKWKAWRANAGMARTEAKRQYIMTLIETMHRYATTTPEARELVAELEFVWDQIKSNPISPSNSPPEDATQSQGATLQTLPWRYTTRTDQVDEVEGLQMLRPFNDTFDREDLDEMDDDRARLPQPIGPRGRADTFSHPLDDYDGSWKNRIEQSLMRITVQIAALHEQLEALGPVRRQKRNRLRAWILWSFWTLIRHVAIDIALFTLFLLWSRGTRKPTLDDRLQIFYKRLKRHLEPVRLLGAVKSERKVDLNRNMRHLI